MTQPRLLIAGVPAAGKTYFGDWLARTHGYLHLDVENDASVIASGLANVVAPFRQHGDTERLLDALERLDRPVVFNWGFPPEYLHIVEEFEEVGFELWWLDADHARARQKFIERGEVPVKYFDIQVAAITDRWNAITELFDPNLVDVLDAAGARLGPEEIWQRIQLNGRGAR